MIKHTTDQALEIIKHTTDPALEMIDKSNKHKTRLQKNHVVTDDDYDYVFSCMTKCNVITTLFVFKLINTT